MKNLVLLPFIVLFVTATYGQLNVEENFRVTPEQQISLNLKFAGEITVVQWDKQEVKVNASVYVDNGEGNSAYSLKSKESSEGINIFSDFGNYFEQKENTVINNCNSKTEISYVVYVPKNCKLKVKSITGNVFSESFSGKLETDLIAGGVELKQYHGELVLKTISGNLDVTMDKANIEAQTLTGTIYSDLDISTTQNSKENAMTTKVSGAVNNGGERAKLETISGNIYMRKG
ncbi:hypothetical protein GCM10007103_09830 [Salinimicrobium marinum]|uniref:Adhesin domain-containing protein n=1 Tax=Salinimicrobium marinum TaxID=680283 RepID=A0A918S9Y5_9FLAO|nr:hypothetical protein [Salinimicrobium marinum]GHA30465.1 hypothetical protein GCM10007103_09830 [Salinimicrobium marinum]